MKLKNILIFNLIIIVIGVLAIGIINSVWLAHAYSEDEKKRQALYTQILDGSSLDATNITINYAKKDINGSPLIFGGSHSPEDEQQDAWNKIDEVGVTSVRKDFFIDKALPTNISLEDYKNNKDGIQDPQNWNTEEIDIIRDVFTNAKEREMATIGIVTYAPAWLTHSGTVYGVPKDWEVYEDLVAKTYRMHRDNLDYVEIWNEPNFDYFLNLDKSNMSREEAYEAIYYHAAKAIREVDDEINDGKSVPLGGPVGYNPTDTKALETILASDRTKNFIDFVSYHNYDKEHLKEPSWVNYKKVLQQYNRESLPVFLTEWNYDPNSQGQSPYHTSDLAITYTGNKFVDFLKMGMAGANYHVLESLDLTKPNEGEGYMGFYRWKNNSAELLPQSRTWRLLSEKMGLGDGKSSIYFVEEPVDGLNAVGFRNVSGIEGLIIINNTGQSSILNMQLKNISEKGYMKVTIYYASGDNDAKAPYYEGIVKVENSVLQFPFQVPADTILGLVIDDEKDIYDFGGIMNFEAK